MQMSVEEQIKIITKGVHEIIHVDELKQKLTQAREQKRPLTIKLGLDPSAPDIHLGHAVILRKIRQMQDMGHRAVIIIGDFTGKIGDPTGRAKGRAELSKKEVMKNALTYQEQVFKVLDREKTEVRYNSEWLSELKFDEILKLASATTVARMMEREDFKTRYQNNIPIGIHEFFYPLMQAYDSVVLEADIELGGTDQTFNILMGRTLQKQVGQEQQTAIFMPILEGLDGAEKMSKSLGNYIGIDEDARVMFKKVMEVPDKLIIKYFELATDEHPDKIEEIENELNAGRNPRDVKLELARIITSLYHPEVECLDAAAFYRDAFAEKGIPKDIPELVIDWVEDKLRDNVGRIVDAGYAASASEFRRLVDQGGVRVNQEKVHDLDQVLICGDILKIGKKKFLKVIK